MNRRDTVLLVDDVAMNRAILRMLFEREYRLLEAENGEQALELIQRQHDRIAVVLLDLVMPVKDGYQVLETLGTEHYLTECPVIVITAEDTAENEVKAFDLGASDIIMKPFEPHVVKRRVQNVVELNLHRLHQQELIDEQAAKLRESNTVMVDALSSIIEYRSLETGQHIQRIRLFTKVLLEDIAERNPSLGYDKRLIEIISSASSMHDIGKIAIPDSILNKPGPLTREEFEIMKTHASRGCEMLATLNRVGDREYLEYAYRICRHHHERWDGCGYPDGLRGDEIPLCAQIVGIADCYDALTVDRVYREALPEEKAFSMIMNGECGAFSPQMLESFLHVRSAFWQLSREYTDHESPDAACDADKIG
ncbi:HD domain-containing phosphohydrolase [Candidatus Soleaferrea massiliensis]|uniref:HD domain-containing phosphohydrolase n=1 Tax=Candidatus Soleaferrea massiliensis TaxID=1470354 RepID=UPI0009E19733